VKDYTCRIRDQVFVEHIRNKVRSGFDSKEFEVKDCICYKKRAIVC
jgi:hypothetical protein